MCGQGPVSCVRCSGTTANKTSQFFLFQVSDAHKELARWTGSSKAAMDSAPLALTDVHSNRNKSEQSKLLYRGTSQEQIPRGGCVWGPHRKRQSRLHFALKHSISRHRFWSQRDLSWNASCHFPLVPFGASDLTLLSSALFAVKWRWQHYLYSVELCPIGENAHRECLVIWSNSIKVNTRALSPRSPLPFSRVFQSIS